MRVIFALVAAMLVAATACAEPIAIANPSFEDPALPLEGGATWTNAYAGWDGPDTAGDSFVELIEGFSSDGPQHVGMQGGINGEVSQAIGALAPNTVYTLTLDIGKRNDGFNPADGLNLAEFGFYLGADRQAGGTMLATAQVDPSAEAEGTFLLDQSVSYTTGETVEAGDFYISLALADGATGRAHYDNVRLDASPVPEPTAGLLAALAGLSGMAFRRRR